MLMHVVDSDYELLHGILLEVQVQQANISSVVALEEEPSVAEVRREYEGTSGRPKIYISIEALEVLKNDGFTDQLVADVFNVSLRTVKRRCSEHRLTKQVT